MPQVINKFTAHCLRHTHATNLFYAGYDVLYIQHQLGHTKPETTLNIYTHLKKEKENQISRLDSYLSVNQKIVKMQGKCKAVDYKTADKHWGFAPLISCFGTKSAGSSPVTSTTSKTASESHF